MHERQNNIPDLTEHFTDPLDLPCCILCDQPICTDEHVAYFTAHKQIFIGHMGCVVRAKPVRIPENDT